jgi:xanthine dehydrogenase YagR molybdenum-binding subunit
LSETYVCSVLEMEPEDVRVMSPFVGGAFGSGLRPQYNVVLASLAALALNRSVRLVLTRRRCGEVLTSAVMLPG